MSENVITNANDVELIIEYDGTQRGTSRELGRLTVDEVSISRESGDSLVNGIGGPQANGMTNGNVEWGFSFTMMGEDVATWEMVAEADGVPRFIDMTLRKREGEVLRWEVALTGAKANSEEITASGDDPIEYTVEGAAISGDKTGLTEENNAAWE
jgi:hypothetical protein